MTALSIIARRNVRSDPELDFAPLSRDLVAIPASRDGLRHVSGAFTGRSSHESDYQDGTAGMI